MFSFHFYSYFYHSFDKNGKCLVTTLLSAALTKECEEEKKTEHGKRRRDGGGGGDDDDDARGRLVGLSREELQKRTTPD